MSDYRIQHQPSTTGAPLHNLSEGGVYPADVYTRPQLYTTGEDETDTPAQALILATAGRPDALVTIYRCVPVGVHEINTGDWVSIVESYARRHGYHPTDTAQDLPVIGAQVRADQIRTDGNSWAEWGYYGPALTNLPTLTREA